MHVSRNHRLDQWERTEVEDPCPLERHESSASEQALDITSRAHLPPRDRIEHAEPARREVVDENETAKRAEDAGHFPQPDRLVRPVMERDGADHQIELRVRKRKALGERDLEPHIRARSESRSRHVDHVRRRIDTREQDCRGKAVAESPEERTRPAADVEHRPGTRRSANHRLDRGGDDTRVELGARAVLVRRRSAIEVLDVAGQSVI